jgi:pyridoxal/pyridoxine/pyridoxamine kinase
MTLNITNEIVKFVSTTLYEQKNEFKMPMDEVQNTLYKMVIERNFMHVKIVVTGKIPKLMQICIPI